jgi:hypothetical protein
MKNRTSAAKAGYGSVMYGTAEPVPFQHPVLTQTLKPNIFSIVYGPTKQSIFHTRRAVSRDKIEFSRRL